MAPASGAAMLGAITISAHGRKEADMMEGIHSYAEYVAAVVNVLAITAIAIGSIYNGIRLCVLLLTSAPEGQLRPIWLSFGRWLVVALTFQLAADIVETILAPGWNDIGKLAAIAVLRTFLNFFLDRDMDSLRERARAEQEAG